jgi:hypothetical protein
LAFSVLLHQNEEKKRYTRKTFLHYTGTVPVFIKIRVAEQRPETVELKILQEQSWSRK